MMCTTVTSRAVNTAKAGRRLAALSALLALAGAASAETTITMNNANLRGTEARSVVSAKADKSLNNMRAEKAKLVSGDEGMVDAFYMKQVGPVADRAEKGLNQFEQAVFCEICDFNSPTSLESALPAAWAEYGDAFFNRTDAGTGK